MIKNDGNDDIRSYFFAEPNGLRKHPKRKVAKGHNNKQNRVETLLIFIVIDSLVKVGAYFGMRRHLLILLLFLLHLHLPKVLLFRPRFSHQIIIDRYKCRLQRARPIAAIRRTKSTKKVGIVGW